MDCGGSSRALDPSYEKINWNYAEIHDEFKQEQKKAGTKRKTFEKASGKVVEKVIAKEDREFYFFEGADAGSRKQFMSVRPYEGVIVEPHQYCEPSKDPPDVTYDLEYLYGYRAEEIMNCFFNKMVTFAISQQLLSSSLPWYKYTEIFRRWSDR